MHDGGAITVHAGSGAGCADYSYMPPGSAQDPFPVAIAALRPPGRVRTRYWPGGHPVNPMALVAIGIGTRSPRKKSDRGGAVVLAAPPCPAHRDQLHAILKRQAG